MSDVSLLVALVNADTKPIVPIKRTNGSKREMPLSCQRCRLRKVKCNFAHPCSSCVKLGVECIQVPNDMRKKRPPANYVLTLEKRNDALSKFFTSLEKLNSPEERDQFFNAQKLSIMNYLDDTVQSPASEKPRLGNSKEYNDDAKHTPSPGPQSKIRLVYGPTSVYENELDHKPKMLLQKREVRDITLLKSMNRDPDILQCLRLFFTWQYPDHNMFVFREAFLIDFFNPKPNSLYCLPVLALSICALGARMCDVDTIYSRSITYYNEARSSLLSHLEHPSITAVQSFLLLAFYDICNGNNSTGWMLSGNAMRMGFDLGFQLNPEVWFLKNHGAVKALDVAIRSRIYWGCYMADHFISLVLGRPSLLKLLDASIPETQDLPELDWIDDYKYIPDKMTNISDPLKNIINLINISDNMLSDIFTKSDHETDSRNDDDLDLTTRLTKLSQYNAQITEWKENLPSDLNWNQDSLREASDNPTTSCVRFYYYILILCLNRPFVGIASPSNTQNRHSPAVICHEAIEDLYVAIQGFELKNGLRRASIFIVYCSILSISVILLTTSSDMLREDRRTKLKFFLKVLAGCSKTWGLAEKSYKLIESKLQLQFVDDPDFAPPAVDNKKSRAKRTRKVPDNTNEPHVKPESIEGVSAADSLPAGTESLSSTSSIASNLPPEVNGESGANLNNFDVQGALFADGDQANYGITVDENGADFFGGPPVLMTSDLFNEDWEALFPDSIFNSRVHH